MPRTDTPAMLPLKAVYNRYKRHIKALFRHQKRN